MVSMLQKVDWSVLRWIHGSFSCGFLNVLMPKITMLGSSGAIWILAALLLLCTRKYRRYGVILLAGLAAGALVGNVILKPLVARPRPCWLDTGVRLLVANPTDYSFPSGHTLSSAVAATVLTKTNRKFGFAAVPLAVLIAFSRLYLYVHFPSDVLAAVLIGVPIGCVAFTIGKKWPGRRPTDHRAEKRPGGRGGAR